MLSLDAAALKELAESTAGEPVVAVEDQGPLASTRRYYRMRLASGKTVLAMFVPDASPDEVTSVDTVGRTWPWLEVHGLLKDRGIHVPGVLGQNLPKGLLLIEDLGNETLAQFLVKTPDAREALYTQAVTNLAAAQASLRDLPSQSIVSSRVFDAPLLHWELEHFREYGVEAQGKALSTHARTEFEGVARRLAKRIAALPRAFVHRDYQSRNLLVRGWPTATELVWIDFQDALLGPRAYDLVALLNDSYQSFTPEFVEARLDDYARAAGLSSVERVDLGNEFNLITVQRKLKDAGRFIFIHQRKDNPAFLPFFEPSLFKAARAMKQLPGDRDIEALAAWLRRHVQVGVWDL